MAKWGINEIPPPIYGANLTPSVNDARYKIFSLDTSCPFAYSFAV